MRFGIASLCAAFLLGGCALFAPVSSERLERLEGQLSKAHAELGGLRDRLESAVPEETEKIRERMAELESFITEMERVAKEEREKQESGGEPSPLLALLIQVGLAALRRKD